jgi:hypothetical protein
VLDVWDRAGIDFPQWQRWKKASGLDFLSREPSGANRSAAEIAHQTSALKMRANSLPQAARRAEVVEGNRGGRQGGRAAPEGAGKRGSTNSKTNSKRAWSFPDFAGWTEGNAMTAMNNSNRTGRRYDSEFQNNAVALEPSPLWLRRRGTSRASTRAVVNMHGRGQSAPPLSSDSSQADSRQERRTDAARVLSSPGCAALVTGCGASARMASGSCRAIPHSRQIAPPGGAAFLSARRFRSLRLR